MQTHFLTIEIALHPSPTKMQRSITTELQKWGEPLRWAITAVDTDRQTVQVEAVVTTSTEFSVPLTSVITA